MKESSARNMKPTPCSRLALAFLVAAIRAILVPTSAAFHPPTQLGGLRPGKLLALRRRSDLRHMHQPGGIPPLSWCHGSSREKRTETRPSTEIKSKVANDETATGDATGVKPNLGPDVESRVVDPVPSMSATAPSQEEKKEKALSATDKDGCDSFYIENPGYADVKPESAFLMGGNNFLRQGSTIVQQFVENVLGVTVGSSNPSERLPACLGVVLENESVREAERVREARPGGRIDTNPASRFIYDIGCFALDTLFEGRPIPRFWVLETIARIPYFSYVSMLHLYESFGWWRGAELRKVHSAQEWNEMHHLLIMEALGGSALWSDRFLGYHIAIGYYWAVNALFLFSPKGAYEFMELLESHAVDTYSTFLKVNEERLKSLPAPRVACSYYESGDLYLFDDFQVSKPPGSRRPPCDSLYDVFKNISEDEAEHVKTMMACKDYAEEGKVVVSPHASMGDGTIDDAKRKTWKEWSEIINRPDSEATND